MHHSTTILLALLVAALCAGGCARARSGAATTPDGAPRHGGSIVVSVAAEPPIINPWLAQGAMAVTMMLVDGLSDPFVALDEHGAWRPVLAEQVPTIENGGVTAAPDSMVITLPIRSNAHWSDGEPIDCRDVEFTWRTVTDASNQLSNRFGWDHVTSVECPTPTTARIVMDGPYSLYLSRMLATGPLPRHALAGKDFNTAWNEAISVSSGPFRFVEWQRGVRLVLERDPHYWNRGKEKLPYLDRITYRFVKDANTLKMQLRMTEADVALIPPDTNISEELEATPDVEHAITPGAAVELLALQTRGQALRDVRVRQALAYAIDRDMITSTVLKGIATTHQQSVVPTLPAYSHEGFAAYRHDPARAAHLLASAGYRKSGGWWTRAGRRLTVTWVAAAGSNPFRARIAQLVQAQLRAQGIDVVIELSTPEVLYSDVAPQGRFDVGEWSEPTGIEPAPALLYSCVQIPRAPGWAGKNRFRWCDRSTDALLTRADREVDPEARARTLFEVDDRVAAEVPMLPLFRLPDVLAWNRRVHGVVPNPAMGDTWNIDRWWVSA